MLKQHLFQYQGHIGAYLIVAGVDPTGPKSFSIHAHGSTDVGFYLSLGSGSMAAMAVLEARWHKDITKDEAIQLVSDAIESGIWNDLGSGSNVDLCVMETGKPSVLLETTRLLMSVSTEGEVLQVCARYYWYPGHEHTVAGRSG